MGLFDLFKSKLSTNNNNRNHQVQSSNSWHYDNRNFTQQSQSDFSYFLHNWVESKSKSPKEQYEALKSFVIYMHDLKRMCQQKGDRFVEWFETCADDEYIQKREDELKELEKNLDKLEHDYNKKSHLLQTLEVDVANKLSENQGILQSDFVKLFDPIIQDDVKSTLYYMDKNGTIERTKSGRSYILKIKA